MADPQLLAGRLEHIVGRAGVSEGRGVTVDGPRPMIFVRPSAAEEAASCLAVCSEVNAAVIPAGLMTWLGGGNRVRMRTRPGGGERDCCGAEGEMIDD